MLDKEILWELEDDWLSVRAKGAKVARTRMEKIKKVEVKFQTIRLMR